ncbi:DNA repair protein complementing XP-C cells homolog [Saccoglossus kowalevskii]
MPNTRRNKAKTSKAASEITAPTSAKRRRRGRENSREGVESKSVERNNDLTSQSAIKGTENGSKPMPTTRLRPATRKREVSLEERKSQHDKIDSGRVDFEELTFTPRSPTNLRERKNRKCRNSKKNSQNEDNTISSPSHPNDEEPSQKSGKKCQIQQTKEKRDTLTFNKKPITLDKVGCNRNKRKRKCEDAVAIEIKKDKDDQGSTGVGGRCDASTSEKFPRRDCSKEQMSSGDTEVTMETNEKSDDSSDESDWEEVEELKAEQLVALKSQLPEKPLEITVDMPESMKMKRRKKYECDLLAYFRRQMNRYNKEQRIELHKVHLLCLVASGFYQNEVCNDVTLTAIALSMLPQHFIQKKTNQWGVPLLTRLLKWFKSIFVIDPNLSSETTNLGDKLIQRFENNMKVGSEMELVHIFVIFLRVLQLDTRLVLSLQPMSYKVSNSPNKAGSKRKTLNEKDAKDKKNLKKSKMSQSLKKNEEISEEDVDKPSTSKPSHQQQEEVVRPPRKRTLRPKNDRKRSYASKIQLDIESDDGEMSSEEDVYVVSSSDESEEECTSRKRGKNVKKNVSTIKKSVECTDSKKSPRTKTVKRSSTDTSLIEANSDSDFEPEIINLASGPRNTSPKATSNSKSKDSQRIKTGRDQWVEVYSLDSNEWICIDCVTSTIAQPDACEKMATHPLSYVLAFDNDNHVKDVTSRYASKWMSHTRKQRVDEEWWQQTLTPYQLKDKDKSEKEDLALQVQLQQQPMPTSVAEYKNHPLYALKRHLLKFEGFYPENPKVLGFCRGEPVYARECVHTLHTRETWLKEGRVVRVGEKPYKLVKARPKPKKKYQDTVKNEEPTVPVFGRWQTEEYEPPLAVDGKVPRNEHGNVELFLPRMLPKGTVHLQIPGLNRVARKLNIDCAQAMIGWDFHGGYCHPLFDGFVVCEEHQEMLLDAWQQDQQETERKEREKKEKRVLKHWKLLIKGLLIRERLKKRFQTEDNLVLPSTSSNVKESAAPDLQMSWPLNKQLPKTDQNNLFPFEKL